MGRPGKFEGNSDEELAERLYENTLESGQEEDFGSVDEGGWFALVADYQSIGEQTDRLYIVEQDSQGFFTIIFTHEDDSVVRKHFERMEEEQAAWEERRP